MGLFGDENPLEVETARRLNDMAVDLYRAPSILNSLAKRRELSDLVLDLEKKDPNLCSKLKEDIEFVYSLCQLGLKKPIASN